LVESLVRDGSFLLRAAARVICAGGLLTALVLGTAASAGSIEVTAAGDEYEAAHPKPVAPAAGDDFQTTMDKVFGQGRWRQTSGYRTQAQENALRRHGAGTVAPGHISRHSLGDVDAPSAYDAVVYQMSAASAAARLRRAGGPFSRVLAEGAHGGQGPHLHIELATTADQATPPDTVAEHAVYRRSGGKRSLRLIRASSTSTTPN
jgi:hypothetical protein